MFPAEPISDRGDGRDALLPAVPVRGDSYGSDSDDDEGRRLCRICLESDHPEDLIAPCMCKGSSKWVHRTCLNLWRTYEQDRAFAACTECQFPYRYEKQPEGVPLNRQTRFCFFVSRDICMVTVAVQAVIAAFGLFIYSVLRTNDNWNFVCHHHGSSDHHAANNTTNSTDDIDDSFGCRRELASFYLLGLFGLLVCMGIFGSIFLCRNGCKIPNPNEEANEATASRATHEERSHFYSSQRRRRQQRGDTCICADPAPCWDCCCYPRYYGGYYPYYYGPSYSGGDCCCCCPTNPFGGISASRHSGSGGGGNNHDCGGDAAHIMLIALLIFAIVMAIIGLTVGVFVGVVIAQRIVQRHMFLLQKHRLVEEYQVADLSKTVGYEHADVEVGGCPPQDHQLEDNLVKPSAPPEILNTENEMHLRKLGLLE